MNLLKKVCAAVAALFLAVPSLTPVYAGESDSDFEAFLESEFKQYMEADFMDMHYTIKDYEALGIIKPELNIGDATWESFEEAVYQAQASLDQLHTFDYNSLSEENQKIYATYEIFLESIRDMNSYPQVYGYFDPATGLHENLLTNFTEYIFYRKQDIDDYLDVLESVPQFLEEALVVTKRQAGNGFFLRDDMLDMTEESIDEFTSKTEDSELIIIFNEQIDEMEGLTEDERQAYKDRNRDIVLNSYIPAYRHVRDELEQLRGSRSFDGGLSEYADGGLDYYKALVRYKTSSDKSIEEQFMECSDFMEWLVDQYIDLYMANPRVDDLYETETVSQKDAAEVLAYLESHLANFPEGPDVVYKHDYLDPSIANDATVAYYVQPPLDDIHDNVIRINPNGVSDENDLYSTLAHEGFPGHLYQITWFADQEHPYLRSYYGFMGYTEGWGMYSEWCAWDFSDIDPDAAELNKIYIALGYVEDAAVDLAVNGLGWSEKEVADWLDSIGLNSASAGVLRDFVIQRPGLLLPYGVGMMNFIRLRTDAEERLGQDFNLKEFHTVLLTDGDRPFDMVAQDVNAYIASKSGSTSESGTQSEQPSVSFGNYDFSSRPDGTLVLDYGKVDYTPVYIILGVLAVIALIAGIVLHKTKKRGPLA